MNFQIPAPLRQEHEELHAQLRHATHAGGEIGEHAKALAQLMHPHFVKEDRIALPPLALLVPLARGDATPDMAAVLGLTDQLAAELPSMLAEHQNIVGALHRLRDAAQRAARSDIGEFAQRLIQHARTEEEVIYPAAILVGMVVRQRLGEAASAVSSQEQTELPRAGT